MKRTFDLYRRALKTGTKAELSRRLNVHFTTWTRVETDEHLPAAIAGKIAMDLGDDPKEWIVVAALEAMERKSPTEAKTLRRACQLS